MGYYLNADVRLTFASEEAVVQAAQALTSEDQMLPANAEAAWDVIENAWEECSEFADTMSRDDAPLLLSSYANGKWYSGEWKRFSEALAGRVTGVVDFDESAHEQWRERFHADGTITQHAGKVVYEGDEGLD